MMLLVWEALADKQIERTSAGALSVKCRNQKDQHDEEKALEREAGGTNSARGARHVGFASAAADGGA
jgi:hypothetical protein